METRFETHCSRRHEFTLGKSISSVVKRINLTDQSLFSSGSIANDSIHVLDFHLRDNTVSIAGREIISHAIFTNLLSLPDIVKYPSLSRNHKSHVLYRCFQSISRKGDSKF